MADKTIETDFSEETGFFVLQLRKEDVGLGEEPIDYQGKTFQPKDEVHITIFGSRLGEIFAETIMEEPLVGKRLRTLIEERAWTYEMYNEWYHVVRDEEETIIQMAGVPRLAAFYRQVEEVTGVEIPERPTHVTLYTYNNEEGIGVATEEEFKQLVVGELSPEYLEE